MVKHDNYAYPPRGLCREEAARYVGVGASLFDEMVKDGRMPKPKRVNTRAIWDRAGLDAYFTDLPSNEENRVDYLLRKAGKIR